MNNRLLKFVLGFLSVSLVVLVGIGYYMLQNDKGLWTTHPTYAPTTSPSPTNTGPAVVAMMRVPVPADSSCKDCHKTGSVDVPNVPVMGHPLEGWANCSSCHGKDKLVQTAPGHKGIHQDACLMCHIPRPVNLEPALPRPHHQYPGKECTDCHKPGGEGPLPTEMQGRDNCWVCHIDSENQDLFSDEVTS